MERNETGLAQQKTGKHGVNTELINIGSGPTHTGAWHRAIAVAKGLHEACLWDGQSLLILHNAPDLHYRLCGVNSEPAYSLEPGKDCEIEERTVTRRRQRPLAGVGAHAGAALPGC